MNLKTSLNFSVDKVNFEEVKNSRFSKAVIHAFADGQNAHTLPIETDVLRKSANSIYDIPILCKYSEYVDDFLGHEEDEIPIGFINDCERGLFRSKKERESSESSSGHHWYRLQQSSGVDR